jgi:hypothetical protein
MGQEDTGATLQAQQELRAECAQLQRMGLRGVRFRQQEIEALVVLRHRWRQGPDASDLPAEDRRLKFARWLVEHGRLSEDDGGCAIEETARAVDAAARKLLTSESSARLGRGSERRGIALSQAAVPQQTAGAGGQAAPGGWWRGALRRVGARVGDIFTWLFVPGEHWDGSPYEFTPYPYMSPWSYMYDPLFWQRRHTGL